MCRMGRFLERLWRDERAISSIEYALLLAMISSCIAVAAAMVGGAVFNQMMTTIESMADDSCGKTGAGLDGGTEQGGGTNC